MAITGIPGYTSPPFQSLRCACGVRFVVLVGSDDHKQAAMAEAERLRAGFVDARRLLAFECFCGAQIDVSSDTLLSVQ
jgi:hypothetical protein